LVPGPSISRLFLRRGFRHFTLFPLSGAVLLILFSMSIVIALLPPFPVFNCDRRFFLINNVPFCFRPVCPENTERYFPIYFSSRFPPDKPPPGLLLFVVLVSPAHSPFLVENCRLSCLLFSLPPIRACFSSSFCSLFTLPIFGRFFL